MRKFSTWPDTDSTQEAGSVELAFIWGAGSFPYGYTGVETVVYGHHNNAALNADGWPTPKIMGRTIGIDTIAHGVLSAVRLPDRKVFQSARSHVAVG